MEVTIEFSECFLNDSKQIYSKKVADELKTALSIIETIPTIGSKIIAKSLKDEFGEDIYKWIVGPFDLIYTFQIQLAKNLLNFCCPADAVGFGG